MMNIGKLISTVLLAAAGTFTLTLTTNASQLLYFYSATGTLVNAQDSNGNMSSYLTRGVRYDGSNATYAVANQKDVTALLDLNGKVSQKYNYTAYGIPTTYSDLSLKAATSTSALSITQTPYSYSDYYTDPESSNYYLNSRYYNPVIGTFLTFDTYNLPNRYAYVNGNPVTSVDPTGHIVVNFCGLFHISLGRDGYGVGFGYAPENVEHNQNQEQQNGGNRQNESQQNGSRNRGELELFYPQDNSNQKMQEGTLYLRPYGTESKEGDNRIYVGNSNKAYYLFRPKDNTYNFGVRTNGGEVESLETGWTDDMNCWKPGWSIQCFIDFYERKTYPENNKIEGKAIFDYVNLEEYQVSEEENAPSYLISILSEQPKIWAPLSLSPQNFKNKELKINDNLKINLFQIQSMVNMPWTHNNFLKEKLTKVVNIH